PCVTRTRSPNRGDRLEPSDEPAADDHGEHQETARPQFRTDLKPRIVCFVPDLLAFPWVVVVKLTGAQSEDRVIEIGLISLAQQPLSRLAGTRNVFLSVEYARQPLRERRRQQRNRDEARGDNRHRHTRSYSADLIEEHRDHRYQPEGSSATLAEDDGGNQRRRANGERATHQWPAPAERRDYGQRQERDHVQRHIVGVAEQAPFSFHAALFDQVDAQAVIDNGAHGDIRAAQDHHVDELFEALPRGQCIQYQGENDDHL